MGFIAPASDIQSGDPNKDHDPFDPDDADPAAFQLTPLIVSSAGHTLSGKNSSTFDYGVTLETSTANPQNVFSNTSIGALDRRDPDPQPPYRSEIRQG